jgi:hypothetical protein
MKRTKITSALVALAIAAVLSTSAQAVSTTYNEGDLLIGFEQQNGSGGVTANNYVVDLGAVSSFIGATSNLTFNLNTTDLVSAFGSAWASNTGNQVQWGVIGGSDLSTSITVGSYTLKKNTLFLTQGEITPGTQSPKPATGSNSTQGNINGNIQQFALDFAGVSESSANAAIVPSNDAIGWSASSPGNGAAFGSSFAIEQPASGSNTGPTNSVLDLYQLNNTTNTSGSTAIYLGDFTLSSGGVLTFVGAQAVPEPSAYAMGVIAAALFFVLRRRKAIAV